MDTLFSRFYLFAGFQPYTWFYLAAVASLLDALTTVYALRMTGTKEANVLMAWVMSKIGIVPALVLLKGAMLLLLYSSLQASILYAPMTFAIYLVVTLWNLRVIYQLKTTD